MANALKMATIHHNEMVKVWSSIIATLSSGLFAATAALIWAGTLDDWMYVWAAVSIFGMLLAGLIMLFLRVEEGA